MAITIIERPYKCSWSRNDIRYVFQLDNLDRVNLRLQVKLMWSVPSQAPVFAELVPLLAAPDSNGFVYLYIQDYLNSLLQYVLPDPASNSLYSIADSQACMFTIQYRELSDGAATPAYTTTEDNQNYRQFCIKGGIEKHKHSRNNYFVWFNANKPFLTWQPGDRMIDKNDTICLSFLNPYYTQYDYYRNFTIKFEYRDVAGNTGNYTVPFNNNTGLLFHLRIPVANLTLAQNFYNSTLYKLDISILESAASTLLFKTSYYFEYRPIYQAYDLIYHNSLGGIDFVRVKGEVEESFDRTTEEADAGFDTGEWNSFVKSGEAIYSSLQLQRKFKGDIGYLREKKMQYALLELLVSKSIYQLINFRWVPVISLQKSAELGPARQYLNSFPIEWALSESNEVFTPLDFSLSKGNLL